jgi:hypothetical protein
MRHLDAASQIDRMIAKPLVESGQQRDLGANGGGHGLGRYFPGQPVVENVDLLVVLMLKPTARSDTSDVWRLKQLAVGKLRW